MITGLLSTISGLIGLGNKLIDKYPDYKESVGKDWNECVKQFESYKNRPREKRISSYVFQLKQEVELHLIKAKDYIK